MAEHKWGRSEHMSYDWDGAQCEKCGLMATNYEISSRQVTIECPGKSGLAIWAEYNKRVWLANRG